MTGFTEEQKAALSAKLDASHVKSRNQAGRSLSYVEGWHAIAEANRIFGFDRWHRETIEMRQLGEPRQVEDKWRVGYMAKVKVEVFAGDRAIIREGCGYGSGIDRDVGSAHESALKEAETDAMKRALMTFGNPFGLALYDKTQENVEKPEPQTKAPPPAKPAAPAAVADFWKRASYELPGNDLLLIASKFVKATEAAPNEDALNKLEDDNRDHLAAIKNGSASEWQKVQTALSAARKRFIGVAA